MRIRAPLVVARAQSASDSGSDDGDASDTNSESGGTNDTETSTSSSTSRARQGDSQQIERKSSWGGTRFRRTLFYLQFWKKKPKQRKAARPQGALGAVLTAMLRAQMFVYDLIDTMYQWYRIHIGHPYKLMLDVRDRLQYIVWCIGQVFFRLYQRLRVPLMPVFQVILWASYVAVARLYIHIVPQSTFWLFFVPQCFMIGGDPGKHFKPFGVLPLSDRWWKWQDGFVEWIHTAAGVPFVNIVRIPHGLILIYVVLATHEWYTWARSARPLFGGYLQHQMEMDPLTMHSAAYFGINGFVAFLATFVPMLVLDVRKFFTGIGEPDGRPTLDVILNEFGISRKWKRRRVDYPLIDYHYTLEDGTWRLRLGKDFLQTAFPYDTPIDTAGRMSKRAAMNNEMRRCTALGRLVYVVRKYFAGELQTRPLQRFMPPLSDLHKFTLAGRIKVLLNKLLEWPLRWNPLGNNSMLDLLLPRDTSITSAKILYAEQAQGDTIDVQRVWPAEEKMTQNNIFDRLLHMVFPQLKPN